MIKWKILLTVVIYFLVAAAALFVIRLTHGPDGLSSWRVGLVFFLVALFGLAYSTRER